MRFLGFIHPPSLMATKVRGGLRQTKKSRRTGLTEPFCTGTCTFRRPSVFGILLLPPTLHALHDKPSSRHPSFERTRASWPSLRPNTTCNDYSGEARPYLSGMVRLTRSVDQSFGLARPLKTSSSASQHLARKLCLLVMPCRLASKPPRPKPRPRGRQK